MCEALWNHRLTKNVHEMLRDFLTWNHGFGKRPLLRCGVRCGSRKLVLMFFFWVGNEMVDSGLYFLKWYIFILIVLISYYSINYRGATGKTKHLLVFFRKVWFCKCTKNWKHPNEASWCNRRGLDASCCTLKPAQFKRSSRIYWSRLTFSVL